MRLVYLFYGGIFAFVLVLLTLAPGLSANPGFDIIIRSVKVGSVPGDDVIARFGYPVGTLCEATLAYTVAGRTPASVQRFAVFVNDGDNPAPRSERSPNTPVFRETVAQIGTAQPGHNRLTVAALDLNGSIIASEQTRFLCVEIAVETLECDFDHNVTLRYSANTASTVNLQTVETAINLQTERRARSINRTTFADTIVTNVNGWGMKPVSIIARSSEDANALGTTVYCPRGPVAVLDNAITPADTPVTLDVLANDLAFDAGVLALHRLNATSTHGGTIDVEPGTGAVTYTPAAGFAGVDTFNYGIRGSIGGEALGGTVRVIVEAPPPPPPPPPVEPPAPPVEPIPVAPRPTVTCPAGMVPVATVGETILRDGGTFDLSFSLPDEAAPGVLVVVNKVGHPDLGCPTSGEALCDQVQDNEAFDVLLNGEPLGSVGDPGGHGWHRHTFNADPGAGAHTVRFAHIGTDATGSPGSTTVEAAYCAPPPADE